jgi:hypothetical protein
MISQRFTYKLFDLDLGALVSLVRGDSFPRVELCIDKQEQLPVSDNQTDSLAEKEQIRQEIQPAAVKYVLFFVSIFRPEKNIGEE